MTPSLSADDFIEYFRAVHGASPFPWQARLARQVIADGTWPEVLDLPTGSGKTAALDIAVFHLAASADLTERKAAMRIAFVVDRRLVVDEAYERAERIHKALANPTNGIVRRVAESLRRFSGDKLPLQIARLRGGVPREKDWAKAPCQPTILCSTVDQVGSRLMFRGYGVSERMAPVHAGLLGSDALILLDEAHLSEPFRQTLLAVATEPVRGPDRSPFAAVLLSATPGKSTDETQPPFRLDETDRATAILGGRLRASKPVSFRDIVDTDDARSEALATEALALAERLGRQGIAPIVGVVANRVARARSAFQRLRADDHEAVLVIGRSRPVDRDEIAGRLRPLKTGADRPSTPLFVVGTQALEAGIDCDLDAMVTEAAPLDSLRQRFGRLNRAGRAIEAVGVVLGSRKTRNPDPIYGAATAATVAALWPENDVVDFGIDAMAARLDGMELTPLLAPRTDAPVLMPAYVGLWAQTAPRPTADPETSLFLHGPDREPASVQIVWRADLDLRLGTTLLRDLLTLAPPRAGEVLELPIWAARQWLRGAAPDLADIAEPETERAGTTNRRAFRWAGQDDARSDLIEASAIRPGDVLVVPAGHGGCDEFGWAPDHRGPVKDVFDRAGRPGGQGDIVRIAPVLMEQAWREAGADPESRARAVKKALEALGDNPSGPTVFQVIEDLVPEAIADRLRNPPRGTRAHFPYAPDDARPGVVLVAPFSKRQADGATGDDTISNFAAEPQTLREHTGNVERIVAKFAQAVGLPPPLCDDLALAARLHDAGKADRRFQRVLSEAGPFAPAGAEPFAKSARGVTLPGTWERAGLPKGWRHEALSVRMAAFGTPIHGAHDRALVLYLIGSHHGLGRPFFPHEDPADEKPRDFPAVEGIVPRSLPAGPGPQSLAFVLDGEAWAPTEADARDCRGLDWFTMIRELRECYGAWGLARLEAMLRLADHRASAGDRS